MRAIICCFFLLAISFQPTIEDEEKSLEIIASRLQKLKDELLNLDAFCKGSSRRDIWLLEEAAWKLDSARAHASDKLSLYSSRAGLAGGAMMIAGLIPNPFSPALLYYGSYLTASSVVGHVSNAVIEESYELDNVVHVLENADEFYEVMVRLEDAYNALLKLQPEAVIKGKNGRTLTKEKQRTILFEIEKLWDMKSELEEKKEITLSETVDFANSVFEFVDYVYHAFGDGSVDLSKGIQDYRENQKNAVGLLKQANSVSKFVRDVSYRSVKNFATGVIQYGSAQSQSLLKAGPMKTAFVGFGSVISVITESKNIEEVSRKIKNREELIRLLRDVANDMRRVCNDSPHCVT